MRYTASAAPPSGARAGTHKARYKTGGTLSGGPPAGAMLASLTASSSGSRKPASATVQMTTRS